MLVLSRRQDQKILFPSLGISVEVIGIRGRNVKLGIDAPPSVRIVREELMDDATVEWDFKEREATEQPAFANENSDESSKSLRHRLNNRLNALSLKLQIAEKQIANGDSSSGLSQIHSVLGELTSLESRVGEPETAATEVSISQSPSRTKVKILLVEDNANERHLLSTVLQMSGIEVNSVADGSEALEFLAANPAPDLILIDMQMPRLNGPQTISIIRNDKQFANIPIYGVSGSNRSDFNIPISDRGVNGWFAKPVQTDQLLNRIFDDCGFENAQAAELN